MRQAARSMDAGFWGSLEKRVRTEWLLVSFVLILLTLCMAVFGTPLGLTRLDHAFYDKMLAASARATDNEDIVIIAIDDSSIDALGYRSEEHTSELQSLMRISYAVFCLKKKKNINLNNN